MMSADQGDQLGVHWIGVFHHLAVGVPKNVEKAIEYLKRSSKEGNCQSSYQLYFIYSTEEGHIDIKKAYHYLEKACLGGVTMFDDLMKLFKQNYDELVGTFISTKKPSALVNKDNRSEVENIFEAYVNELKTSFSQALSKDRLYHRPAGFLLDNQTWMLGVQTKYFLKKVLRFDHADFIKAIKLDLGPLLGDVGQWALTNYVNRQREKGNVEKRKQG